VLYELARICWAFGQQPMAFKILCFLLRQSDSNLQYLPELAKYYEASHQSIPAYELLMKTISERNIKLPIIYFYCVKFAEDLLEGDDLQRALDFLLARLNENIHGDSKCRLLMEIGQIYHRLGQSKQAQSCLKLALELAPNLLKLKVYLTILRLLGRRPPMARISQIVIDINRDRFVSG